MTTTPGLSDRIAATTYRKMTPPLKYHGGKHNLADWIIGHMPSHLHYVEPYAGGLSVLLRKPCDGVSEVVNDLDGELMNFWRVLQSTELFEQFCRRIEATPFSSVEFADAVNGDAVDRVDAAVRFFIRVRQSRQALCKDFATLSRTRTRRAMNEQASAWLTAIDGLPDIHERLKRVVIFNRDACDVIKQQDGPRTLFYCDPPYLPGTRVATNAYACEMTRDDHVELLETLAGITGKFVLSGYANDLYDAVARDAGWHRVDRIVTCSASGAATKPRRCESLWLNCERAMT